MLKTPECPLVKICTPSEFLKVGEKIYRSRAVIGQTLTRRKRRGRCVD
jgi:hypothetical protein